jgi:hypothetical protein
VSAALRHQLAEVANCLLRYASRMWQRADKADCPHDRAYYERVGDRYFQQSCEVIAWADALAVNPDAQPEGAAIGIALHLSQRRKAA